MDYKYDIALSFAGEDREYVDKVAQILKDNKVRVFYDKFEEVDLWGQKRKNPKGKFIFLHICKSAREQLLERNSVQIQ